MITETRTKESLKTAYNETWFWTAPAMIVGCAKFNTDLFRNPSNPSTDMVYSRNDRL